VRRVNVKGISGSGKSTFAVELARRLELPYIELDALHHGPNWSEPAAEEFRVRVRAAMDAAPGGWVIDGNYEGKLGNLVLD
jgi:adenylate kinase family enzyme